MHLRSGWVFRFLDPPNLGLFSYVSRRTPHQLCWSVVAVCCSVLQCVAVCCSVMSWCQKCWSVDDLLIHVLIDTLTHHHTHWHTITSVDPCLLYQCVQDIDTPDGLWRQDERGLATCLLMICCCSVLQCVAVCCSVLQCVAVWCLDLLEGNTLQQQIINRSTHYWSVRGLVSSWHQDQNHLDQHDPSRDHVDQDRCLDVLINTLTHHHTMSRSTHEHTITQCLDVLMSEVLICWCSVVAVCCSVLQCVAVWCLDVRYVHLLLQCVAVCCSVLQCVAVCCSVMSWYQRCWSVVDLLIHVLIDTWTHDHTRVFTYVCSCVDRSKPHQVCQCLEHIDNTLTHLTGFNT